jgi:hypothetical protein
LLMKLAVPLPSARPSWQPPDQLTLSPGLALASNKEQFDAVSASQCMSVSARAALAKAQLSNATAIAVSATHLMALSNSAMGSAEICWPPMMKPSVRSAVPVKSNLRDGKEKLQIVIIIFNDAPYASVVRLSGCKKRSKQSVHHK